MTGTKHFYLNQHRDTDFIPFVIEIKGLLQIVLRISSIIFNGIKQQKTCFLIVNNRKTAKESHLKVMNIKFIPKYPIINTVTHYQYINLGTYTLTKW